jgi:hypothetical protein
VVTRQEADMCSSSVGTLFIPGFRRVDIFLVIWNELRALHSILDELTLPQAKLLHDAGMINLKLIVWFMWETKP